MSEEERCELTDLLVAECSHCRGLDKSFDESLQVVHTDPDRDIGFPAMYKSVCDLCEKPIKPGDIICYSPQSFQYVHQGCA